MQTRAPATELIVFLLSSLLSLLGCLSFAVFLLFLTVPYSLTQQDRLGVDTDTEERVGFAT